MELIGRINRCAALLQQAEDAPLRAAGLSRAEFDLLGAVRRTDRELTPVNWPGRRSPRVRPSPSASGSSRSAAWSTAAATSATGASHTSVSPRRGAPWSTSCCPGSWRTNAPCSPASTSGPAANSARSSANCWSSWRDASAGPGADPRTGSCSARPSRVLGRPAPTSRTVRTCPLPWNDGESAARAGCLRRSRCSGSVHRPACDRAGCRGWCGGPSGRASSGFCQAASNSAANRCSSSGRGAPTPSGPAGPAGWTRPAIRRRRPWPTPTPRLSARPRSRTTSRSTTSAELDLKGAGGDLPQLLLRAASGPAPASAPRSARSPSVGGPAAGTSRGDRPRSSSEACAWVPGRGTTGRPARDSMRSVNSSTVVPLSASKS